MTEEKKSNEHRFMLNWRQIMTDTLMHLSILSPSDGKESIWEEWRNIWAFYSNQ